MYHSRVGACHRHFVERGYKVFIPILLTAWIGVTLIVSLPGQTLFFGHPLANSNRVQQVAG
jgi:hypothetical protein